MKDFLTKNTKYILIALCLVWMANKDDVERSRMSVDINVYGIADISDTTYSDAKRFRLFNKSDSVQFYKCVLAGDNDLKKKDTVTFPLSPMSWSPGIFVKVLTDASNPDTLIYWGK